MKDTKISWCDHTFNPWIGCTKVSPGCANCYAETMMNKRWGKVKWGAGNPRQRTSAANWKQPLRWNKEASPDGRGAYYAQHGAYLPDHRPRVFCGSLCDWLDDEVPIEWLVNLLNLIHLTPNLDWLLLTKRPKNWQRRITDALAKAQEGSLRIAYEWAGCNNPPPNVWIGTTVEDQKRADERIPQLLSIPSKLRFLSCEPLLGRVDLTCWFDTSDISPDWIIAGGESGPNARLMNPEWARSLRNQCQASNVPFFMKQMMVGNKLCHNLEDFPEDLRIREFPTP